MLAVVACDDDDATDDGGSTPPTGSTSMPTQPAGPTDIPKPDVSGEPTVTSTGLQIIDIEEGDGQEAVITDRVTVHYTGWLEDGTMFDSSIPRGQPTPLSLDQVIQGWTEGVTGMKVGGKRRLIIPPELAYGEAGFGDTIPPGATLTFDIELVSIP
jgi:peptidylprolyl isomerase